MYTDIVSRATELENLVAANELNSATKRLLDFVTDFPTNRRRRREIIIVRSTYNELREELRLYGKTDSVNHRTMKLRSQILESVDVIKEEYSQSFSETTTSKKTISTEKTHSKPFTKYELSDERDDSTEVKTGYELEKDNYFCDQTSEKPSTSIVFDGKGISKTYKGGSIRFTIDPPINLTLKLGEITAVVGENGSGKTTLLRIVAGNLRKSEGEISYPYLTKNNKIDLYSIKQQIAYIPQELPKWYGLLANNLHFAASIHGITGQKNEDEVDFVISRLDLDKYRQATWGEISGGYRMRFSLARVLILTLSH